MPSMMPTRILGLIALERGDSDAAANYLLQAGASPGSPQLDSFGPTLDLADRLLQAGRTEEVKIYLQSIQKFWDMDQGSVARWIEEIESGDVPHLDRFALELSLVHQIVEWLFLLWPILTSLVMFMLFRRRLRRKALFFILAIP